MCKRCDKQMTFVNSSSGPYYLCKKCNDVQIPLESNPKKK